MRGAFISRLLKAEVRAHFLEYLCAWSLFVGERGLFIEPFGKEQPLLLASGRSVGRDVGKEISLL